MAAKEGASSEEYYVSYSAKDVIVYALSIGFGSVAEQYENDLRYLYEEHTDFAIVPTFCLTLLFWALPAMKGSTPKSDKTSILPDFPPPMMNAMGVLPRGHFRGSSDAELDEYPLLHTAQTIQWHQAIPIPGRNNVVSAILKGKFLSVTPKSIGTFVTTETKVYIATEAHSNGRNPLCTVQSTMLIHGLSPEMVIPLVGPTESQIPHITRRFDGDRNDVAKELWLDVKCNVAPNQALLYRLASGDSNRIHVDPTAVPILGGNGCILHGLCTMGIATRVILQHLGQDFFVQYLSGTFVKPVFVNDHIVVKAWKLAVRESPALYIDFVVQNTMTGETCLEKGRMVLQPIAASQKAISRL